ncbi:MAG: HAMP domain-containing histidine kinase [Opitutaceae bacterium]|nr:HAMP domain-containing histidine kinase [Cytophagales bacterium]
MKIRYQLTFLFTTIVASFLFVFCLSVYFFYSQFREREFFSRLKEKAHYTAELWDFEEDPKKLFQFMYDMNLTSLYSEQVRILKNWQENEYVSDKEAEKVISFEQYKRIASGKQLRARKGEREILGLLYKSKNKGNYVIIVSAVDKFGLGKLDTLFAILATGWALSVIFVMLAGYFFAGNILKPISEIINEVSEISFTNMQKRLSNRPGKDEISELSRTFNQLLSRLEDSFKMQKSFVSNASHEIRNPLASIKAQLDVTMLKERDVEEYGVLLKSLSQDIDRMIKIANGLLELAKVSGDFTFVQFETCRVDEIILEAANSLVRYKPEYNFTFDYETLPEEEDLLVSGSSDLLYSAFYNIIENGCKYSNNHKVAIKLSFSKNEIILQFQDQGIGISNEDNKRIFEPFYRSEVAREYTGIGLGLSLVQKIIQQHKGKITIHSEEGVGTLVTVKLNKKSPYF